MRQNGVTATYVTVLSDQLESYHVPSDQISLLIYSLWWSLSLDDGYKPFLFHPISSCLPFCHHFDSRRDSALLWAIIPDPTLNPTSGGETRRLTENGLSVWSVMSELGLVSSRGKDYQFKRVMPRIQLVLSCSFPSPLSIEFTVNTRADGNTILWVNSDPEQLRWDGSIRVRVQSGVPGPKKEAERLWRDGDVESGRCWDDLR